MKTKTFKQFLEEGKAGVQVAQSKKTQKKLRDAGYMEAPGHYHRKGEDWEDTRVRKPKKRVTEAEDGTEKWHHGVDYSINKLDSDRQQKQLQLMISAIRTGCAPWLKETDAPLFRGVSSDSASVKQLGKTPMLVGTVRQNRKPKDSSPELHHILDDAFEREFGVKARSTSLFCSFSYGTANSYGAGRPHIIFPRGEFHYLWSPSIADPYAEFQDDWMSSDDENVHDMIIRAAQEIGEIEEDEEEPFEAALDLRGDSRYAIIEKMLADNTRKLYLYDKGLQQAEDTTCEIMLMCKQYYAVSTVLLEKEFGLEPDEFLKMVHE